MRTGQPFRQWQSTVDAMLDPRLANQSLSRPLTHEENALAQALEAIFAAGTHSFALVAAALQDKGVQRPSGSREAWNEASLEQELASINAAMDAAYTQNGIGA